MQITEEKTRNITITKVLAGYSAAEYLLVLTPHQDLWQKIMEMKNDFANKYKHPMAAFTKPHLTLLKFVQLEAVESRIVTRVANICASQPATKIEMRDFNTFPSHTIYINVTSKVPIQNLVKALKEAQPLLKFDTNLKPHFMTEPHITVARQLLPWQFEKAWLEYSHSSFTGRFIAAKTAHWQQSLSDGARLSVSKSAARCSAGILVWISVLSYSTAILIY